MLESVGLDDRAEETYRYLVAHSPATAAELADLLGAGEQRVRRDLDSLVALGLACAEPGRGNRFAALDPRWD
ncbi:helix-turn-helix domain-containing protein [Streptacidiphilus carbonis]|uniref:helix-turn-helix domain-containing protein n=1 Tax=Streptacidiphilus carbonis TaxID=105422 RepID=UPI0005A6EF6F|nr:helix-turn-helix domain-containing protein [Streptacidiphilus carbonis]